MTIGNNIKRIRTEKEISQFKLGEISDVPQTTISNIEKNKVVPGIATVMKLAKGLNVPLSQLINGDDEEK